MTAISVECDDGQSRTHRTRPDEGAGPMTITRQQLHTLLRSRMSEKPPLTAWDAEASAIVGALGGFIIGGTYEISEALLSPFSELESFVQITTEISAATVGGGLLAVLFSAIDKRLSRDQ